MGVSTESVDNGGAAKIVNMTMPGSSDPAAQAASVADIVSAAEGAEASTEAEVAESGGSTDDVAATAGDDAEAIAREQAQESARAAAEQEAKEAAARAERFERAKATVEREKAKRQRERQLQMSARRAEEEKRAYAAQAEQYKQRAEALERAQREFLADPAAHLEKMGVTAEAIARKAIEESAPEAKYTKLEKQLQERLEQIERREKEASARAEAESKAMMVRRAEQDFVQRAADANRYPVLARIAEVDPSMILREAKTVLEEAYRKEGVWYTDDEAREYLESKYAKFVGLSDQKSGTGKSALAATALAAQETRTGSSLQEKKPAGIPQTLTSKANARATAPPSLDEVKDPREEKRILAELYKSKRRSG